MNTKRINLNRGAKIRTPDWDTAFAYCAGQQFDHKVLTDEECDAAIKLCEQGASPMQAAIELFGARGRFSRKLQGPRRGLLGPDGRPLQ